MDDLSLRNLRETERQKAAAVSELDGDVVASPEAAQVEAMTIYLSLLVALIGLFTYALSSNAKVQEIGQIAFFCGLLAFLLGVPAHPIGLPPR